MVPPANETTSLLGQSQGQSATAAPNTVAVPVALPQASTSNANDKNIDWIQLLGFIYPYVMPRSLRIRAHMVVSFICVLLAKFATLLPPVALKWAVDELVAQQHGKTRSIPMLAIALFFLGYAGDAILKAIQQALYAVVSTEQTRLFGVECFRHLQFLDYLYHVQRKTGVVTKLISRGADSIDTFINRLVYTLVPSLVEAFLVFAIFFHLGTPLIAVVTLISVVAYIIYTKVISDSRIKIQRSLNNASEAVSNLEIDNLTNFETVKLFGMERHEGDTYDELRSTYRDKSLDFRLSLSTLNSGQSIIQVAGTSIALLLAAKGAVDGYLTPGDFVMISQYVTQLFVPLAFLGTTYRLLVRAATDIEKSMDLLNTRPLVKDAENATPIHITDQQLVAKEKGGISFENVTFSYRSAENRIGGVRDLSFHVQPGQMLGIVGTSGSGKSTLIRLLVRLFDPDEGRILIDGEDIKGFTQESLRKLFGVVAQDTSLFNRSLRYNIAYGKVGATDQEIFKAIEVAQLTNLDTHVGERGVKVSGGERQRIGVARSIIKTPIFVLLDEATSSLDSETEYEMQKAINEICRGRTTVAVAHRLSTVAHADQILVLENGHAIEQGTHKQLLKLGGKYKSMWVAQTA